jgi:hypothetical protein
MNQYNHKPIILLGSLLVVIFSMTACRFIGTVETGPTQTKNETIETGGVDTAGVDVSMGVGQLNVTGGADDLLEAEFQYNIPDWEPEVTYSVSGDNGRLKIAQPDGKFEGIPDSDVEYTWNLQFNEQIPLEMDISLGAGENDLDLRTLNLERLGLETGAGSTAVIFGGSPLRIADIKTGFGDVRLDLSGQWETDANISIDAGVGEVTVVLPSDVGVIVDAGVGLGDLNASGFRIQGDNYVNDAYETSPITLSIDLQGGVGEITLQLEG